MAAAEAPAACSTWCPDREITRGTLTHRKGVPQTARRPSRLVVWRWLTPGRAGRHRCVVAPEAPARQAVGNGGGG
jgi:hypothetical protein